MSEWVTVDARGLACPQPVILAKRALERHDRVIVIVADDAVRQNVMRLAESSGCDVAVERRESGIYELRLEKREGRGESGGHELQLRDKSAASGPYIIVFSDDKMGRGDDELGAVLVRAFIHVLAEQEVKPDKMIFYNGGARLAVEESPVADDLRALAECGVEMLICGTCADYYKIKNRIIVGAVSNMYDIAAAMGSAGRLVMP